MELKQIKSMPTVRDNVHESVYRSYQILEKVKEMLSRGDSKETIIETIKYLEEDEKNTVTVTDGFNGITYVKHGNFSEFL